MRVSKVKHCLAAETKDGGCIEGGEKCEGEPAPYQDAVYGTPISVQASLREGWKT